MAKYKVMVDDNFHYQNSEERYQHGQYDDLEDARSACAIIVVDSLRGLIKPGMSATELFDAYKSFGDDPFIVATDDSGTNINFSAWEYAQEQCRLLCSRSDSRARAVSHPHPTDNALDREPHAELNNSPTIASALAKNPMRSGPCDPLVNALFAQSLRERPLRRDPLDPEIVDTEIFVRLARAELEAQRLRAEAEKARRGRERQKSVDDRMRRRGEKLTILGGALFLGPLVLGNIIGWPLLGVLKLIYFDEDTFPQWIQDASLSVGVGLFALTALGFCLLILAIVIGIWGWLHSSRSGS